MIPTLKIDIVSDVVCPWCAIGYAQLQRAIADLGDRAEIDIRWHPFELVPDMPPEGKSTADHLRDRYGASPEQGQANRQCIVETGAALGIDFRYSDTSRIYSTHKAHQLLTWADEQGKQTALKLALFKAYFTGQRNISDSDILVEIAGSVGLDPALARSHLDAGSYADQVSAEMEHWIDQNVTGVPAFIINGKYMIPGAQDAETFGRIFDRILQKEAA